MSGFNVLLHFLTTEQSVTVQYRNILDKQIGIVSHLYIVYVERFHKNDNEVK